MCFSLAWLANLLIWLIVVCAIVALINLVIKFVVPHLDIGAPIVDFVVKALWIVLWAIICIAAVIFVFDLIAYISGGGIGFPRVR